MNYSEEFHIGDVTKWVMEGEGSCRAVGDTFLVRWQPSDCDVTRGEAVRSEVCDPLVLRVLLFVRLTSHLSAPWVNTGAAAVSLVAGAVIFPSEATVNDRVNIPASGTCVVERRRAIKPFVCSWHSVGPAVFTGEAVRRRAKAFDVLFTLCRSL